MPRDDIFSAEDGYTKGKIVNKREIAPTKVNIRFSVYRAIEDIKLYGELKANTSKLVCKNDFMRVLAPINPADRHRVFAIGYYKNARKDKNKITYQTKEYCAIKKSAMYVSDLMSEYVTKEKGTHKEREFMKIIINEPTESTESTESTETAKRELWVDERLMNFECQCPADNPESQIIYADNININAINATPPIISSSNSVIRSVDTRMVNPGMDAFQLNPSMNTTNTMNVDNNNNNNNNNNMIVVSSIPLTGNLATDMNGNNNIRSSVNMGAIDMSVNNSITDSISKSISDSNSSGIKNSTNGNPNVIPDPYGLLFNYNVNDLLDDIMCANPFFFLKRNEGNY